MVFSGSLCVQGSEERRLGFFLSIEFFSLWARLSFDNDMRE